MPLKTEVFGHLEDWVESYEHGSDFCMILVKQNILLHGYLPSALHLFVHLTVSPGTERTAGQSDSQKEHYRPLSRDDMCGTAEPTHFWLFCGGYDRIHLAPF